MKLPLQITTRKFSLSKHAEEIIKQKAAKLEQFYQDIIACRVMVETPHRHKSHGSAFNVRIDLTVPGAELIVKREPHEDLYVAIRDAFEAAKRQLKSISWRKRGAVKTHVKAPVTNIGAELVSFSMRGQISKLFTDDGFGYLKTHDGREVYFSEHNLMDLNLGDLEIGHSVRFDLLPNSKETLQAGNISLV